MPISSSRSSCWRCRARSAAIRKPASRSSPNFGRYGPFVQHERTFANLESFEDIFTVGLNRAVTLIAERQNRRPGGRGASQAALRDLGPHPEGGGTVQVFAGRYGPYVKFGKINATLPKTTTPETVTLEEAVALIEVKAKDGKARNGKSRTARKPAKKAKATAGEAKTAGQEARRQEAGEEACRQDAGQAPATAAKPPSSA